MITWIQRISTHNRWFSKIYLALHPHVLAIGFRLSTRGGKEPVLVYQMGRVGSTTVARSLAASGFDAPIYHAHFLAPAGAKLMEQLKMGQRNRHARYRSRLYLLQSQFLSQRIGAQQGPRFKVITLVRDPVAVNISGFFHNIHMWLPTIADRVNSGPFDHKEVIRVFLEQYPHHIPLSWFDDELKQVFGIDVFETKFPISRGFKIYQSARADILLVRLEDLDRCGPMAFEEYLGMEDMALTKANVSSEQPYAAAYRTLMNQAIIPLSYADRMYSSRYARHFYSDKERECFRAKWCHAR